MSKNLLILGGIAAVLFVFREQIAQMVNAILPSSYAEEAKQDSSQPSTYRETYQIPGSGPVQTDYTGTGQPGVGILSFSEPMGTLQYPAGSRTQTYTTPSGSLQFPAGAYDPTLNMQQVPVDSSGKWDNALTAITLGAIVAPPAYRAAQKIVPQALQRGKAAAESVGARIGAVIEDAAAAVPAAASRIAASPVKAGAAAAVIAGGAYAVTHPTETKAALSTIAQKSSAVVDVAKQKLTNPTKPVLIPAIIKAVTGK